MRSCEIEQSPQAKVALQFRRSALVQQTEGFIYNVVNNCTSWTPVYLSADFINQDQFPLNGRRCLKYTHPRCYPRIVRRVINRTKLSQTLIRLSIRKCVKASNPDLTHAHMGQDAALVAPAWCRRGSRLIASFYGKDIALSGQQVNYTRTFKNSSYVIVEGQAMGQKVIAQGCPEEKIRLVRIAIPVADISLRKNYSERGTVRLLFCGRFVEKKGLEVLLQAVSRLVLERGKGLALTVIGDGRQRSKIEALIYELGISAHVKLQGTQPRHVFWSELHKCDLFVAPSRLGSDGDTEGGAPTTILEAQAVGVPVVTTTHADIPNVVVPGKSAIVAEEGCVESLTEALSQALSRRFEWPEMGKAGRRFVEAYHAIEAVMPNLEAVYDECGT